jgi:hypothetical protein
LGITDRQVRRLMEELARDGCLDRAALHADMDRKTARKYRDLGKLPSELKKPRTWRTRSDPFTHDWAEIKTRLAEAQEEVEARALLVFLMAKYPERYREGHLRTLQRRIRHWRATEGPPKEVFFPQDHRPGEAMQTDFTWGTELGITIRGEPFDHLICHPVLPFSNWEWVTVCHSESLAAMRRGVQEALFRLGHVPEWHQTDNSTAATHDLRTGKRAFNEAYVAMVTHCDLSAGACPLGSSPPRPAASPASRSQAAPPRRRPRSPSSPSSPPRPAPEESEWWTSGLRSW